MGLHGLPRRVQVKKFCPLRVDAAAQPVLQQDKDLLAISSIAAQQRFRWAEPGKLREHPVTAAVAVELRGIDRAGGDIAEAEPPAATFGKETGKIVVTPLFQHGALRHRAGGDDAGDIPAHQALGRGRVFRLFADGDFIALGDEPGDIAFGRVERHAAHRRLLRFCLAPVPGRQGQLQLLGGEFGVLAEHLIKITQPEEQDAILVLRLDLHILFHHGGKLCHGNAPFCAVL